MSPIPLGILASTGIVAGSFDLLQTELVTGSNADTITFSNLNTYATTYKHLQLRMVMRDNRSPYTGSYARLQFNNDTATNYSEHALYGTGSGVGSGYGLNTVSVHAGEINASDAPAGAFAPAVLDILEPFSTNKYTTTRLLAGTVNYNWLGLWSGTWRNTAAVHTIKIISPLGDFVPGCRFSLYGIKAA